MVSNVKNMLISVLLTLADFANPVRLNWHNFSPDHGNSAIFPETCKTQSK